MRTKRLETIGSLIPKCDCFCDIGCDHGYLAMDVVKTGLAKKALACDVNIGPLKTAEKNIEKEGLSSLVKTRLSDGFSKVNPGEADCICIAGMGGRLIIDILSAKEAAWVDAKALILSPHRDESLVREYVSRKMKYDTDTFVYDAKTWYTVMRFVPYKNKDQIKNLEEKTLLFGLNPKKEYLLHEKERFENILSVLILGKEQTEVQKKITDIRNTLNIIDKIL